jgi:acetyl-CoA carboxylase carboxyl transferase subunit beta
MSWLTHFIPPKIRSLGKKRDVPESLWSSCLGCEKMIFQKHLEDNLFMCTHCGHHAMWPVAHRLAHLFDDGYYQALPLPTVPLDPLGFRDQKKYTDRLKDARQKTKESDAVTLAVGKVGTYPVVVACFNFAFIGGSMGMAAGEALIQGARMAVDKKACFLMVSSSGGARMQEGILSLMQMPRSTIAVQMVKEARLPVVMLMAHPTTGGVAASFAALGDVTFAEPGAIIGFTGARVIQETLRQPLPEGFQTSEFQKKHGFVDLITSRSVFRETFSNLLQTLHHSMAG